MNNQTYVIFAGYDYYPDGGSRDINCFCESIDQAKEAAIQLASKYEWVEVYDLNKQESCFELARRKGKVCIVSGDDYLVME